MNSKLLGFGLIIISALSFGFMPIFADFSYQHKLEAKTILLFRFVIAAILLNIYLWWRGFCYPRGKALVILIFMGAILYSSQAFFYFSAIKLIGSSLTSILFYSYPNIVLLFSIVLFRTKIQRIDIIALVLATIGAIMIIGLKFHNIDMLGVSFGLGAAIVYALYILVGSKVAQSIDPLIASTVIISSAASIYLIYGVFDQIRVPKEPESWISILAISLISTIVAISAFFYGLKIIGPVKASMISILELIITLIFSFLLIGEQIGMTQIIGSFLILCSALLLANES